MLKIYSEKPMTKPVTTIPNLKLNATLSVSATGVDFLGSLSTRTAGYAAIVVYIVPLATT